MNNYKNQFLLATAAVITLCFTACNNPANNVNEAEVRSALEESAAPADGKAFVSTADSKIGFEGSKVTGSHEGGFETFTATIVVKDGQLVPNGTSVEIDMDSTWSDSDKLTGHLKNEDFFDVPSHPTTTFKTTLIEKADDGYNITGNFNLHGVTKSITFPAEIQVSETEVKVNAEFFIKRFDFNIEYPGKADNLIRDEVVIKLNIVAVPS